MAEVGFGSGHHDEEEKKEKAAKAPRKGRTKKQRDYVKHRKLGKNKKDAALAAHYALTTAENVSQKIETPEMVAEIDEWSKKLRAAIPDSKLLQRLDEGLDATLVKTATLEGEITDTKVFVDYPTRLAYVEKIALMSKRYQPKGNDTNIMIPIVLNHSVPRPPRG